MQKPKYKIGERVLSDRGGSYTIGHIIGIEYVRDLEFYKYHISSKYTSIGVILETDIIKSGDELDDYFL